MSNIHLDDMNKDIHTTETSDDRTVKELDFRFSHLRHVPKIGKLKSPKSNKAPKNVNNLK